MRKIIFKFWQINILISIGLFIAYRTVIAQTSHAEGGFFENVLHVLNALLDVAYSFVYLIAIVFSSLTLFLNQIEKVRSNFYLSLLTFLGIPLFCVIFIVVNVFIYDVLYTETAVGNLLNFSIIYLLLITIEFLLFRKRIKKLQAEGIDNL